MKWKQLKKIIDKMSNEELEQEIAYNSKENDISGKLKAVSKSKGNLYWNGEDDPCQLQTKKELQEDGYDDDDIAACTIEIAKGQFFLNLT